jgi:hypothetical protein
MADRQTAVVVRHRGCVSVQVRHQLDLAADFMWGPGMFMGSSGFSYPQRVE